MTRHSSNTIHHMNTKPDDYISLDRFYHGRKEVSLKDQRRRYEIQQQNVIKEAKRLDDIRVFMQLLQERREITQGWADEKRIHAMEQLDELMGDDCDAREQREQRLIIKAIDNLEAAEDEKYEKLTRDCKRLHMRIQQLDDSLATLDEIMAEHDEFMEEQFQGE